MILGLVLSLSAASALAPDGDAPTFAADVYPVLEEKCLSCHDAAGGLAEAGLDLTTVAGIEKGGKRGPAAKKGKSGESLLYLLASKSKKPAMPPEKAGDPLTSGELALVRKWIDRGMPAGAAPPPAMKKAVKVVPGPPPPGVRPVLGIDLDKTGALLAFGSGDAVFVHELPSGKRLAKLPGPPETTHSLRISADGTWLAAGGFQSVHVWKIPANRAGSWPTPLKLDSLVDRATALDISADGKRIAAGGGVPASSGEAVVWELPSGKLVKRLSDCHTDAIYGIAFDAKGERLLTGSGDKFLKVHEIATGKRLKSYEGHSAHVLGVGWRGNGKQVAGAGADGVVKVWDYESGDQTKTIAGFGKQVTGLRWFGDTARLATSSSDRQARLVNADSGGIERGFGGAADALQCVALSGDGKRIAAGADDGKVWAWNAENAAVIWNGPDEKKKP